MELALDIATAIQHLAQQQRDIEHRLADVHGRMGSMARWATQVERRISGLELQINPEETITEAQANEIALAVKTVAAAFSSEWHQEWLSARVRGSCTGMSGLGRTGSSPKAATKPCWTGCTSGTRRWRVRRRGRNGTMIVWRDSSMVDYSTLLTKYIAYIADCEGIVTCPQRLVQS